MFNKVKTIHWYKWKDNCKMGETEEKDAIEISKEQVEMGSIHKGFIYDRRETKGSENRIRKQCGRG